MTAIVKSVEIVQVTIDNSSQAAVNLSKGQDETKCVPWHTARYASAPGSDMNDEIYYEVEIIDNSGTAAVKCTHDGRTVTTDQIIEVFVVEFVAAVLVQQIAVTTLNDGVADVDVLITDITDQTTAFILYCPQNTGTADDDYRYPCVFAEFSGATTDYVHLERWAGGSQIGAMNGTLYVVSCSSGEFTVEHLSLARGANQDLDDDMPCSATVMANTFLIHSYEDSQLGDDVFDSQWIAELDTTTNVKIRRAISGSPGNTQSGHRVQVVECQGGEWDVQRNVAFTLAGTSDTDTITAIDQARSIIIGGHLQGALSTPRDNTTVGIDKANQATALDFSSNTLVRAQRQNGSSTDSIIAYEVVQFVLSTPAAGGVGNPLSGPLAGPLRGPF